MNPLKLTKILFLSLLSLFAFTQTTFALNVKNIPDNVYTKETMPKTKEELCELWSGYSYEHTRVEVEINPPNWQNRVFVDFKCFYDDGKEKLEAGWRRFELKKEEIPQAVSVTNKRIPNDTYEESNMPDPSNPLNYCDASWPYELSGIFLSHKIEYDHVFYNCTYMYDTDVIFNDESYFSLLIVPPPSKIPWCTNPNALNYNPEANEENWTCIEKIEWCTDSTAINYNPSANVHKESTCEYSQNNSPQDITGAFEKSQVSIGATTWTVRFNLNVPGANLDPSTIQTWDQFTAVDSTTNDKTVTITLRQFDDQRLDVECTNYEVTIPRHALTTTNGDTNPNPISGNFEVVGCDGLPPTNGSWSLNVNIGSGTLDVTPKPEHKNTIKENNFYLSLYDTDENGKVYINLTNTIYILGLISFFLVLFFVLFWFIKNSFLWKSKR